jgi:hypothetical protein
MKNAHLRRTFMYTSFPEISGALHLEVLDQPAAQVASCSQQVATDNGQLTMDRLHRNKT